MRSDPAVVTLVSRAAGYDQEAWNEIVDRYIPLVWAICVRYRLSSHDTEDVCQSVWLLLVEHLAHLREPAALPGWLATTTRHECLRVLRAAGHYDLSGQPDDEPDTAAIDDALIAAERDAALRAAFAELPPGCRQLLSLLISDPPVPYARISTMLGIRIGSIGPRRARCLERLRRSRHLVAFTGDEPFRIREGERYA